MQDKITVSFPFNPAFVEKIRAVAGRRWHPEEKYWSFRDDNGTLEKILEVFKGEEIQIDPALSISARVDPALQAEERANHAEQTPTFPHSGGFAGAKTKGGDDDTTGMDRLQEPVPDLRTNQEQIAKPVQFMTSGGDEKSSSQDSRHRVRVAYDASGIIKITFPFSSVLIEKVKTIEGRKWHPEGKCWSVPDSGGIIEKIQKAFEGEEVVIERKLKAKIRLEDIKTKVPDYEQILKEIKTELKLRGYSRRTAKGYISHIVKYVEFFGKSPKELTENHIREYIVYLVDDKQISRSHHSGIVSAIKFLYDNVLKSPRVVGNLPRPKKEHKLPTVLNTQEVNDMIDTFKNIKHRAIMMLDYSGGLRVEEIVKLRLEDIDAERHVIHIKGGKGKKDRYTLLSEVALEELNKYISEYNITSGWLFPGARPGRYLSTRSVQKICQKALNQTSILKKVSPHTFRIVLLHICWKLGLTCVIFRNCSGIRDQRPLKYTPMSAQRS